MLKAKNLYFKFKNFVFCYFLFLSILCLGDSENKLTNVKILRKENSIYLMSVDHELDYFINGTITIMKSGQKIGDLTIVDSNNSNDIILVKENIKLNLETLCIGENICTGIPSYHEEFANKKEIKKSKKYTFISGGLFANNDIKYNGTKVDSFGGIGTSFDAIFYDHDFMFFRLGLGFNGNIFYNNFHHVINDFVSEYGSEVIHLVNLNAGLSFFLFITDFFGLTFTPLASYLFSPYNLDEDSYKQTMKTGFSFGLSYGVLFPFGNNVISVRMQQFSSEIEFETLNVALNKKIKEKVDLKNTSILLSYGFSF